MYRIGGAIQRIYNDDTLNDIANDMLQYNRQSVFNVSQDYVKNILNDFYIDDFRKIISLILLCIMSHNCRRNSGLPCNGKKIEAWSTKIFYAIPKNERWISFGKRFYDVIKKLNKGYVGNDINQHDLNRFEYQMLIFVAICDMNEMEKEKIEDIFEDHIIKNGFLNYDHYCNTLNILQEVNMRYEGKYVIPKDIIDTLCEIRGLNKKVITLLEDDLYHVRLTDFLNKFIPLYYGGRSELIEGYIPSRLLQVNSLGAYCNVLPKAKREIIDESFKGGTFEIFLYNLATGQLVYATNYQNPIYGYSQRVDKITKLQGGAALIDALDDAYQLSVWEDLKNGLSYHTTDPGSTDSVRYIYRKYSYEVEGDNQGSGINLSYTNNPSFRSYFDSINQKVWEQDIILTHHKEPKHCIIGSAKFNKKYKHRKYVHEMKKMAKFIDYLNDHDDAKNELNIPLDYPIVPFLFTSFSGAVHKYDDKIIPTTIIPLLQGYHYNIVSNYIDRVYS